MRILHTSDWHLGRSFHGASLRSEQERALSRIVEVATEAQVDVVVVAGDLFDRAIPPADAVELLGHALSELQGRGIQVVALTGNHDSPTRAGAFDPVMRAAGVTLRGRFQPADPVVLVDPVDGVPVVVHPVPFLDPAAHRHHLAEGVRPSQQAVMAWALDAVREDLAARPAARSVVVAHTFVAGGRPADSERDLAVGDVDRVGLETFAGIDCVLLGHLHRPQSLEGDRIAYSGSPLPYSFGESAEQSAVRVVDVTASGATAESVPLGVSRGVCTITGTLESLLHDPAHASAEAAFVRAIVTDPVIPPRAMATLQARFEHAVVLQHRPPALPGDEQLSAEARRSGDTSDLDLVLAFLQEQSGSPVDGEDRALVVAALHGVGIRTEEAGELGPTPPVVGGDPGEGGRGGGVAA